MGSQYYQKDINLFSCMKQLQTSRHYYIIFETAHSETYLAMQNSHPKLFLKKFCSIATISQN